MRNNASPIVTDALPKELRKTRIADAFASPDDSGYLVLGSDGYIELPVATLDHVLLLYRIDNGRIVSELAREAGATGESPAALHGRRGSADVQSLLHRLLLEKAQDPDGPIFEELARHGRQTEPILITDDGTVLNGNRRLASMRELLATDPERFAAFANIRAAMLPSAIPEEELEYIEAGLQMAPDLKLDYSWVNRRLKLRQHVKTLDREKVRAAYRFADHRAIDTELAELDLAEAYLEWKDAARQYGDLADISAALEAFAGQLRDLKDEDQAALWRVIGFSMLKSAASLNQPIEHYFPFTDPKPPAMRNWVLRSLAEDEDLVEPQGAGEDRKLPQAAAKDLLSRLDDPAKAQTTAHRAMAMVDSLKSDQDRLLGATRTLQHLQKARRSLETLRFSDLTDDQLRRLQAETAALKAHLDAPDLHRPKRAYARTRKGIVRLAKRLGF